LGLKYVGADYAGEYAMADFPDSTSLGPTAAVYVGRNGLLESFPLAGGLRRWVARCVTGERPRTEALVAHVREQARVSLDVSQAMHPSSFRAQRFQAARFSEGRVALAGDAAQVVSPIGGQGMNLGWLGARALAATIASNLGRGDQLVRALAQDGLARQRVASAVARRAEVNMWLGRPLARPWMRDALMSSLLGTPARWVLARAFTMRGLALGC
jgi:2-polyprenyl-6-methoxyphenol hydroxylase-like FAD-dependent oxidoreductase